VRAARHSLAHLAAAAALIEKDLLLVSSLYAAQALNRIAREILQAAGVPREPAAAVATGLLQADLYGHRTHGLQLLGDYVEAIEDGSMTRDGAPQVVNSHGAVETWDARRLPGVWTTGLAIERATVLADQLGLGAVALRRSHHIACLAAFLEAPARAGTFILVFTSDPSARMVAPHGGVTPVMTPNPIAAGIPAEPDPILIDVSMSITTGGMTALRKAEGRAMPGHWLLTPQGAVSDDPRVLGDGGALLPIGGLDHGHKGYALGLLVECLTQGLSGHGRADEPSEWGASVLVLVLKPSRFAGAQAFRRQVQWLVAACHGARPLDPAIPVRLPGEAALARARQARQEGVSLPPVIVATMRALAERYGVKAPELRQLAVGSRQ
jgi:LDH2 family malate/lactate/ureidoglycolate dehydrogenase